jgi:acyl-CoA synthetase (AMP-forming)/AMP-acid ligase II
MAVIGGIPPWVIMYFEKLLKLSKKDNISSVFPNFNLFVYGGVNFSPYKETFKRLIGKQVDSIEYYPASEGFFAYQDTQSSEGLLLQLNSGIFYEFVLVSDMKNSKPERLTIKDVEVGKNYVLIVSTNAGLWAYNTGDTIQFVSLAPPRIIVSGRYKHFISAFGEHVIGSEVEKALESALEQSLLKVKEFTVAPMVSPKEGLPFHEWWIEFDNKPKSKEVKDFERRLDDSLQEINTYYKDLVQGKVLKKLEIVVVVSGGFINYMESEGKLGGQNKLPRLSNNRKIVDNLTRFKN